MDTIQIALVTSIITNIVAVYFIYRKSYLTEKGRNLATKEDIEEITNKIESIKNEVSFSKQREHDYLLERKLNIISLLEIASEYDSNIMRVEVGFNIINSQDYYLSIQEKIYENKCHIYKLLLLISIYSNDKQTNEYANNLYISVSELYTYLININIQLNNYSKCRHEYVEKATPSNKLVDRIDEIDRELDELSQNFKNEIKKNRERIDNDLSKYRTLIWVLYKLNFHQKLKFTGKDK